MIASDSVRCRRSHASIARALALLITLGMAPFAWADESPGTVTAPPEDVKKPSKAAPDAPKDAASAAAYVIGTFKLAPNAGVDGDTVRLAGQPSVRVLGIDTEETFKEPHHRAAAKRSFISYAKNMRKGHPYPVKFGTPAGESAAVFVRELLKSTTGIRLERDTPTSRDFDNYGRRLGHVFLVRPEGDLLLAEEVIRQGHSPYFVKYGRSQRFDSRFRKAEAEARTATRGVWAKDGVAHYPDYDERIAWWSQRATLSDAWRALEKTPTHVTLGTSGANAKLAALVGKPAVVRGFLDHVHVARSTGKTLLFLGHEKRKSFTLVLATEKIMEQLGRVELESWPIHASGMITTYKGRPQMVIERADQISLRACPDAVSAPQAKSTPITPK